MPLKSGERFKSGKKKFLKSSQKDMMGPLTGAVTRKMGFLSGSAVKNLPATQETQVQSLGQEDPLEKEMATHSSILAYLMIFNSQLSLVFPLFQYYLSKPTN